MKKYFVLGLLIITTLTSCLKHVSDSEKREFADSMAKALHLKFINTDPEYSNSSLRVFNDTIVGLINHDGPNNDEYFIQSINNLQGKVYTKNEELRHSLSSEIDDYKNGLLYFGSFSGTLMQTLAANGKVNEYFKKYEQDLVGVNKVMIYKNSAVLTSMNGIYVFDIKSQKLLWKYHYIEDPNDGMSAIMGSDLVFTETVEDTSRHVYTNIVCFDLEKLKLKWLKTMNNSSTYEYDRSYLPHHQLEQDNGDPIIPQGDACYAIELETGYIRGKFPWKGYLQHSPRYKVENYKVYVDYNNKLICASLTSGKKIWELKNAAYWGIYKNSVIAYTSDEKFCLLVDKVTGQVEKKIKNPKTTGIDFDFVGKYILFNRESLYQ